MSYILIQNATELPLWGMRLLGYSNKDKSQIGQFGTGLKETVALLCRLELLPIIFSGLCRIDFSVKERGGQDEICFKLSEDRDEFESDRWHGLGIHPNFGKADWVDPWMALREIFCNAIDASGIENLYHDVISDDPYGKSNCTRIYLPLNTQLLNAYSTIENKILHLKKREPVSHCTEFGHSMAKVKDLPACQIFHRGIWIQEARKASLWDYELYYIKLNESRNCDWYRVQGQIAGLIARFDTDAIMVLIEETAKLTQSETNYLEQDILHAVSNHLDVSCSNWADAFKALYGEDAVLCINDSYTYNRIKEAKKRPVIIEHNGLMSCLKAVGIPHFATTLESIRGFSPCTEIRDASPKEQEVFNQVWYELSLLGCFHQESPKPPLKLFREPLGQTKITFGKYVDGICYINEEFIGSKVERIACLEEICHHLSSADDETREFQTYLLEVLNKSMERSSFLLKQKYSDERMVCDEDAEI
ncbi:MAG: hypothetical protein PVI90_17965 [Desulfobacteraceae bacterium]|jgi:hypothetical protein